MVGFVNGENHAKENLPNTDWILFQRDFRVQLASSFFNCSIPCLKNGNINFIQSRFEAFTYRFIIPNCIHLWAKHNECEHSKQQCFKRQEQQKNHCGRWRKERALFPFVFDALRELIYGQEHCMRRYHRNVKLLNGSEQGNELQFRQCLFDSLTVNRTKYFWLFSPTQLFTLKFPKENENKSS